MSMSIDFISQEFVFAADVQNIQHTLTTSVTLHKHGRRHVIVFTTTHTYMVNFVSLRSELLWLMCCDSLMQSNLTGEHQDTIGVTDDQRKYEGGGQRELGCVLYGTAEKFRLE